MKIRTNFVSNSSSSSFLLDNPEDIKTFENVQYIGEKTEVYATDDIKRLMQSFVRYAACTFDLSRDMDGDQVWDGFKGKVPEYFEWEYIRSPLLGWDFSDISNLVARLPDGKWLTESFDRNRVSEYYEDLKFYDVFDGEV